MTGAGVLGRVRPGWGADLIITVVMLGTFVLALTTALDWPFGARLFPVIVSVAGIGLAALRLGILLVQLIRAPSAEAAPAEVTPADATPAEAAPSAGAALDLALSDDSEAADPDYAFHTATRRQWASAVVWVALFFGLLWVFGVVLAALVFTPLYLRFVSRTSVLTALAYALVLAGILYWTQEIELVQLPAGIVELLPE